MRTMPPRALRPLRWFADADSIVVFGETDRYEGVTPSNTPFGDAGRGRTAPRCPSILFDRVRKRVTSSFQSEPSAALDNLSNGVWDLAMTPAIGSR
jgi:hypothetical protein